jgi:predicted MPP superfamily phosphohydrolase
MGFYAWRIEPHDVELVRRALPIVNLPKHLSNRLLVQISDLHIGPRVDDNYLLRCFDCVSRLSPDFVAYTGDFISYEGADLSHARRVMSRLPLGRLGTAGVLGNHDYGPRCAHAEVADGLVETASETGIHMLRNQRIELEGLGFIGMDDLWAGKIRIKTALAGVQPGQANVVLCHNPDSADREGWENYSGWILAGHTHGGQCKPPFLPPPVLPVNNHQYVAGEYPLSGGRRMYVNRGVGHLLQVRFNVRPEITLLRLESDSCPVR